jgi:hypothetical protein
MKNTKFFAVVRILFYCGPMLIKPSTRRAPNALSFKIGTWAEASATGWGLAVLVILAILMAVVASARWPGLLPH